MKVKSKMENNSNINKKNSKKNKKNQYKIRNKNKIRGKMKLEDTHIQKNCKARMINQKINL